MKRAAQAIPNQCLMNARLQCALSQKQVADGVGTTRVTVSRWEHGVTVPSPYFRQQLCHFFKSSPQVLGWEASGEEKSTLHDVLEQEETHSHVWTIPFRRNLLFTGGVEVLTYLRTVLDVEKKGVRTRPQALSGLGGVGKTHMVLEYAYQMRHTYQIILWFQAETFEVLTASFVRAAAMLQMSVENEQDQQRIVAAVKHWLDTHTHWLCIFDNVEDMIFMANYLPNENQGHVLLTTRLQSVGPLAETIRIEPMKRQEGALFLLRRAKLLSHNETITHVSTSICLAAETLSESLGGLPLALDQAGAYIEETGCTLSQYKDRYSTQQALLLNRRGSMGGDHPHSVNTTLSLCLEKVEHVNAAAADFLRMCAFLAGGDTLPEEIITLSATELDPLLRPLVTDLIALDEAIALLRTYSLLHRHAEEKTLSIHRLVQVILKEKMDEAAQHQWARRTVRVVNGAFPDFKEQKECIVLSRYQRFLPQVYVCIALIEQWNITEQAARRLMSQAGIYFREHAQYASAEIFLEKAKALSIVAVGEMHPDVAAHLHDLGELYEYQGKYLKAEQIYRQALAIYERVYGPQHLDIARLLVSLATIYKRTERYEQAELLYQRALAMYEQDPKTKLTDIAISLNDLALLYVKQEKYVQAEPLYQRALSIHEQTVGDEHPFVASSLNNIAKLYMLQGKYDRAEPLYHKALALREKVLGPEHPAVAVVLNNLGAFHASQYQYNQAQECHQRAFTIRKSALGLDHPHTNESCNALVKLYIEQGEYEQAAQFFQGVLNIQEGQVGREHADIRKLQESYNALLQKINGK